VLDQLEAAFEGIASAPAATDRVVEENRGQTVLLMSMLSCVVLKRLKIFCFDRYFVEEMAHVTLH